MVQAAAVVSAAQSIKPVQYEIKNAGSARVFFGYDSSMKTITSLTSAILLLTAYQAHAIELKAGTFLQYVDYQEFDTNGSSLDRETGFLPGIKLQATYRHHTLWSSYAYGNVHYDGQLQSGVPHSTDTNYILSSGGYEYAHEIDQHPDVILLAGFGAYSWQRHILPDNGVPGLNEVYLWQQLHAGLRYKPESIFGLPLEASFSVIRTLNGTVDVNLESLGYGSPRLDLGDEYGFQAGIKYHRDISRQAGFNVSVESSRWEFGRSQTKSYSSGINNITIAEPRSVSWHTRIGIEFEYKL